MYDNGIYLIATTVERADNYDQNTSSHCTLNLVTTYTPLEGIIYNYFPSITTTTTTTKRNKQFQGI
jgi:hypothetical protein